MTSNKRRNAKQASPLRFEALETRLALSAAGLVDVGTQPDGGLADKIVYLHGGHGYTANSSGSWGTQRPNLLGMTEDTGNQDQITYMAEYLFNAGATVVPLRPLGHQPNEVILDNDDVEVTYTGTWGNSTQSIYFGDPGDVPYRFASTSATETATARYQPNIPEDGFYPVYSWTHYGSDRAADQLYKVKHSGGTTEVTINHRRVGDGLVYLGTYHFEAGSDGYVEISNRSSEAGRVVIADMIRFGNGVGDIDAGAGVSGYDREDEAGLYWIQWHVDRSQGISSATYGTSTVTAPNRYATYMNREADGSLSDRVFLSFHSNASTGNPATASARGVVALHNTANGGATPNQLFLAETLGQEINDDLVAQNGQFEHNWADRGTNVLFQASFNYGEINNSIINNEFDATIVETGFHDNTLDAQMLRDGDVRDALARSTYQGLVNYFNAVDGGATADIDLPGRVTDVAVESTGDGEVTVHWTPPATNSYNGDAPTGYMVYASTNGYGFDGGRLIAGGATASTTITGLDPSLTYYFKVAAVNDGGESPGSEVIAAKATTGGGKALVVNGFDRLSRFQNPTQIHHLGGEFERVRPLQSNSYDYAVQLASAIAQADSTLSIDTAANELVESGAINLSDYDSVYWILGEESTVDETFSSLEQTRVEQYLQLGGRLFVSGSEIGFDLDLQGGGASFYNNTLGADYVADDAGSYAVQGVAGTLFEGLSFDFDDGDQFYDTDFPDVITGTSGDVVLNYGNGAGGAAVAVDGGANGGRVVMLAFPFETITNESQRNLLMQQVVTFFDSGDSPIPTESIEEVIDNDDGAPQFTSSGGWVTTSPGYEGGTFLFDTVGDNSVAEWTADLPRSGTAEVFVQYAASPNRASGAHFVVEAGGQTVERFVDQRANGLQWVPIGTLPVNAGELTVTLDASTSTGGGFSLVVADAVRVVLTYPLEASADFNGDEAVSAADFSIWRGTVGQTGAAGEAGDGNLDGVVAIEDYELWREQYGAVAAATAASAVAVPVDRLSESVSAGELPSLVASSSSAPLQPVASVSTGESAEVASEDDLLLFLDSALASAFADDASEFASVSSPGRTSSGDESDEFAEPSSADSLDEFFAREELDI